MFSHTSNLNLAQALIDLGKSSSIFAAVKNKEMPAIVEYLNHSGNPNCMDSKGNALLHLAVQTDDPSIVGILIERGVYININVRNLAGETALHLAIKRDLVNLDIVQMLIGAGANPNARTQSGGFTPLRLAVQRNADELVKILLSAKDIKVDIADDGGNTALHWAINKQNKTIIKLLLSEYRANPYLVNAQGLSPYYLASANETIFEMINEIVGEKEVLSRCVALLHGAIAFDDINRVEEALMVHKEQLKLVFNMDHIMNWQNANRQTLLEVAAKYTNKESILKLLPLLRRYGVRFTEADQALFPAEIQPFFMCFKLLFFNRLAAADVVGHHHGPKYKEFVSICNKK